MCIYLAKGKAVRQCHKPILVYDLQLSVLITHTRTVTGSNTDLNDNFKQQFDWAAFKSPNLTASHTQDDKALEGLIEL